MKWLIGFLVFPAVFAQIVYPEPVYFITLEPGGKPSGIFNVGYTCLNNNCIEGRPVQWNITVSNEYADDFGIWGVQLYNNDEGAVLLAHREEFYFRLMHGFDHSFILNATFPDEVSLNRLNLSPCLISRPPLDFWEVTGKEVVDCYTEFYMVPVKDCLINQECSGDQECRNLFCEFVQCEDCQFVKEHRCIDYECCEDSVCQKDETCQDNICVSVNCDNGYYVYNHTCTNSTCAENEAIFNFGCVPLRCRDSEITKNHQCVPLRCEEWELARNQRCEPLECSEWEVYYNHTCIQQNCLPHEKVKNNKCVPLSCSWYQKIKNHECKFNNELFRDMAFGVILVISIGALSYGYRKRSRKRLFEILWREAQRKKTLKNDKKTQPKKEKDK